MNDTTDRLLVGQGQHPLVPVSSAHTDVDGGEGMLATVMTMPTKRLALRVITGPQV